MWEKADGMGPVWLPETCREAITREDGSLDQLATRTWRKGDRFKRQINRTWILGLQVRQTCRRHGSAADQVGQNTA